MSSKRFLLTLTYVIKKKVENTTQLLYVSENPSLTYLKHSVSFEEDLFDKDH